MLTAMSKPFKLMETPQFLWKERQETESRIPCTKLALGYARLLALHVTGSKLIHMYFKFVK